MDPLFDLSGKVALVTGGGRGLGAALAEGLASRGAAVAVASRKLEACRAAAQAIAGRTGARTLALPVDVADEAAVRAMLEATERELGPLDVLVNNAGATWGAPAHQHPTAAYEKVMAVNVRGTFLCAREAAARWIAAGRGGVILNVASVAGLGGVAPEVMDAAAYSASKAAVVGLTRDLAVKWARHGIRVNALAPGWFPTDMSRGVLEARGDRIRSVVPMGRLGEAAELVGAALLLCGPAGSYVTGQVLAVDGGLTAR